MKSDMYILMLTMNSLYKISYSCFEDGYQFLKPVPNIHKTVSCFVPKSFLVIQVVQLKKQFCNRTNSFHYSFVLYKLFHTVKALYMYMYHMDRLYE